MSRGLSIVGSSRNNGDRQEEDFYPTPPYAIEKLLEVETFEGSIWECACGDGAISRVLHKQYETVFSTDIINRGYDRFDGELNFLSNSVSLKVRNIITNPPFKHAQEFILRSKECVTDKIAMLLKTVFLEGQRRYDMFLDKDFPLKAMYQFSKRLAINKGGGDKHKAGMIAFAWFVWDRSHVGEPLIRWIK